MEAVGSPHLTIRSSLSALRRAAEWYVARGTEGLEDVDAMRVRRLASWILVFSVLLPVIIVAQFLRLQYTTAVVNIFYGVISVGCWEWALQGSQDRALRAMRAQRMILATTVVDLVLTALLNGGINGSGLWYLALVPLLVAPQRGTRETVVWTAVTMVAVCLVALVDPHWPFVRDLEVEPVDVVVTMRLLLIMALGAFATTSVKAMDRYVAAIEEREARLQLRTQELAVAKNETDAARAILQRHLDALLNVSLAAASARSSDTYALPALDEIIRLFRARSAFLFLSDEDGRNLEMRVGRDAEGRSLENVDERMRRAASRSVVSRQPVVVPELEVAAAVPGVDESRRHRAVAVPLLLRGRLLGVLCAQSHDTESAAFSPADVEILRAVGNHLAIALEGARIASQRDDAERRLRESEEQFRKLMAQAADALYVAREGGRIVEANRQACDILGYSREEILEHSVYDFDPQLDEVEAKQLLAGIGAGGHLAVERTLRRKDGSVFPVELRVSRIEIQGEEHFLLAARDITERKLGEEKLEQSHAQLRALSSRLLTVQEEERRHVAREVHDELGQVLTALSLDVGWLSTHLDGDTAAMAQIGKIGDRLDSAIGSVQRIGRELRPLLLDDLGLLAALERLVREFQEGTRIPCVLRAPEDGFSLDRERDTTVFRLVQEALTNVARHAGASRVSVSLVQDCDAVRLTVDDDGRGIRQEEITRRDSLGLLGMRERVHMCGGAMKIRGDAGQGTHLEISIPLPGRPSTAQSEAEARA